MLTLINNATVSVNNLEYCIMGVCIVIEYLWSMILTIFLAIVAVSGVGLCIYFLIYSCLYIWTITIILNEMPSY